MDGELKVRNNVLLEDTYKKVFSDGTGQSAEKYKITALFPADQREIAQIMAGESYQNGLPLSTYSPDDQYRFSRDATLDVAILEGPESWEGVSRCPDEDLLNRLYKAVIDFTREIQEKLKKNRLVARGKKTGTPD